MAKKKKTKQIAETTVASGTQNLGYQGSVKISLARGNKIISTKTYHNAGMPNLFKFFATSLSGNFSDSLRPTKIKLFRFPKAESDSTCKPTNFTWTKAWEEALTQPVQASPFILYDSAPVVKKVVNDESITQPTIDDYHYETTFHFRVPFSYISGTVMHIVGFYPTNATDNNQDISAYYLFTDTDGKEWLPLELADNVGNYSLIIEWTMSTSNKAAQSVSN